MKKFNDRFSSECTKLANKSFGLEMLCRALLDDINCDNESIEKIISLAKGRRFEECGSAIDEVKSSEAYYVAITQSSSEICSKVNGCKS